MHVPVEKQLLFISQDQETAGIQKLIYEYKRKFQGWADEKTLVLMVSPDFSGIVATIFAQGISPDNGEILYTDCIHVPDPDEDPLLFKSRLRDQFKHIRRGFEPWSYEKFILVEAGVISGRNYTWLTEMMINEFDVFPKNILTVALYQSTKSEFQCDLVANYYDHETQDLCFWWEKPNRAFGDFSS
jgi:hypothetical protein